jgi:hypothetical protein
LGVFNYFFPSFWGSSFYFFYEGMGSLNFILACFFGLPCDGFGHWFLFYCDHCFKKTIHLVNFWGILKFFCFRILKFRSFQFSSCHFRSFTWGENNVGGIVLKFGGLKICFHRVQGSSSLFLGILGVFPKNNLVNLNLLSHLFLPMAIF